VKAQHAPETEGEDPKTKPPVVDADEDEEEEDKEKAEKLSGSLIKGRYQRGEAETGFTTLHGVKAGKDLRNPKLEDQKPTSAQVTLISFVGGKYNQMFSEIRTGSKIRNEARKTLQKTGILNKLPNWLKQNKIIKSAMRAPKTGEEIKQKARRLINKQSQEDSKGLDTAKEEDKEKLDWLQSSVNYVDTVGHAWVKLRANVGGKTKELSSFGMHAKDDDSYDDPRKTVPGKVEYPDKFTKDLEGGRIAARTYKISLKKYYQAFDFAAKTHQSPPPYSMVGYHCTTFARDVAKAAGGPFNVKKYAPKGIAKVVTWGLRQLKKLGAIGDAPPDTISPTGLYESLEKDKESYDVRDQEKKDKVEREQIKKELEEEAMRKARETMVFLVPGAGDTKPNYMIPKEEFPFLQRDFMDMSKGDWINIMYTGPQSTDHSVCHFVFYPDLVRLLGPEAARKLRPDYDPSKEKKKEEKKPETKLHSTTDNSSPSSPHREGPSRRAPIAKLDLYANPGADATLTINPKEKGNLGKSVIGMDTNGWVSVSYSGPQNNHGDDEMFVRKEDLILFLGETRANEIMPG